MKIRTNIVSEDITRKVQQDTLHILSDAIAKSFGPHGSTTAIVNFTDQNEVGIRVTHTKDGHTIIKNIQFTDYIERSVQDLLTDLTYYIVREVGDGTSSAVLLCDNLFNALCNKNDSNNPYDDVHEMHSIIEEIKKRILSLGREATVDDLYNICLISTNGNEDISKTLYHVYKEYGVDTFIDIDLSPTIDNIVKEYDGMTLTTGFANMCFVNDPSSNSAKIMHPKIYFFDDPIDTPEMLTLLDQILITNILQPLQPNSVSELVPTVILARKISPDASSYLETIVKIMTARPGDIPLLIVSDITQDYLYEDIAQMCGGKFIKKYINPDIQQKDIENGLAPTAKNVTDFCGYAEEVRSDTFKTQFINPSKMFNEDGSYTDEYNTLLQYLKNQVEKAKLENAGIKAIGEARRRYNSLKGSMIDFFIGGVSFSDKQALKSSVEDAVLNCRSAAINGVGYGANYMAFKVIKDMLNEDIYKDNEYLKMLDIAYYELLKTLYSKAYPDVYDTMINRSYHKGCPLNLRTNEYDGTVLSSIKSDIVILDTLDKVLTMMYITNQYLVPTPIHNVYDR